MSTSFAHPPTMDPIAAARWLDRASAGSPWLYEEVGVRMAQRLAWIKLQPAAWLHWNAVRGGLAAHHDVVKALPRVPAIVWEPQLTERQTARNALSPPWWQLSRWSTARPHILDVAPAAGSAHMLWSNMLLHHHARPEQLIADWHKALAAGGYLMFSCLGPDSLHELRRLYTQQGWGPIGADFTDMHDWGDMLVAAGFAEPIMDMERIRLTYSTAQALRSDLRSLGRNTHYKRAANVRSRAWLARWDRAVTDALASAEDDGRLALTFEIIYGHAIRPSPQVKVSARSAVSLRDMRDMLQSRKNAKASPAPNPLDGP
jgi:malonyl-CoA O-methyltransferase